MASAYGCWSVVPNFLSFLNGGITLWGFFQDAFGKFKHYGEKVLFPIPCPTAPR